MFLQTLILFRVVYVVCGGRARRLAASALAQGDRYRGSATLRLRLPARPRATTKIDVRGESDIKRPEHQFVKYSDLDVITI